MGHGFHGPLRNPLRIRHSLDEGGRYHRRIRCSRSFYLAKHQTEKIQKLGDHIYIYMYHIDIYRVYIYIYILYIYIYVHIIYIYVYIYICTYHIVNPHRCTFNDNGYLPVFPFHFRFQNHMWLHT